MIFWGKINFYIIHQHLMNIWYSGRKITPSFIDCYKYVGGREDREAIAHTER
jgi:hypothetical protein